MRENAGWVITGVHGVGDALRLPWAKDGVTNV